METITQRLQRVAANEPTGGNASKRLEALREVAAGESEFLEGFVTAALWSDCAPLATEDDPDPELGGMHHLKLKPGTLEELRAWLSPFLVQHFDAVLAYRMACLDGTHDSFGRDGDLSVWRMLGHDLFMTGAHHGVGFWDRGLGALGDQLTSSCQRGPWSSIEHIQWWQIDDEFVEADIPTHEAVV